MIQAKTQKITCNFLGCADDAENQTKDSKSNYCKYHSNGGALGNGESYRQYQIIEEDFLNFIKVVPLVSEHFTVHSPTLRDIIIRTCVQIEIIFKEWGKQNCSYYWKDNPLLDKYNKNNKGVRNWKIGDYHFLNEMFDDSHPVEILPLDIHIMPFRSWASEKVPPNWWNVYNEIKHGGDNRSTNHNLLTALEALAALYLMHYTNEYSREYLSMFIINSVRTSGFAKLKSSNEGFTTPIETKQYLFRIVNTGSQSEYALPEEIEWRRKNIR
jgi:hypothetical protein